MTKYIIAIIVSLFVVILIIGKCSIDAPEGAVLESHDKEVIVIKEPRLTKSGVEQILVREGYVTSYNRITQNPNWVAWHLTSLHTDGQWPRYNSYIEDREAQPPYPSYEEWKINPDKYDHGHMCPAADNKWSEKAMEQSFLLTNMCPQNKTLNEGDWQELEKKCRKWAKKYEDIYIVCGPLFNNGKSNTIGGPDGIWVPDAFFKVVLCMHGTPKSIGFIYPNEGGNHSIEYYACSVDYVEELSGIDFFYSLPDDIEDIIESQYNYKDWK